MPVASAASALGRGWLAGRGWTAAAGWGPASVGMRGGGGEDGVGDSGDRQRANQQQASSTPEASPTLPPIPTQPQPQRTCMTAASCACPSCPLLASPQVNILPSAASATLCARPAATETMRSWRMVSTSISRPSSWKWPWPSCREGSGGGRDVAVRWLNPDSSQAKHSLCTAQRQNKLATPMPSSCCARPCSHPC